MDGIVYKAVNKINGKIYIGQTCRSLKKRIKEHKYDAFHNTYNSPFHASIKKYGLENFEWDIVKKCYSGEDLDKAEKYFIKSHRSNDRFKGYNLTIGGNVLRGKDNPFYGRRHTDEVKKKISLVNKGNPGHNRGKNLSEETKRKISNVRKKKGLSVGKNNPMYGKKHSEETKDRMASKKLGRKVPDKYLNHLISNWLVTYPNGNRVVIRNLKKFCRENGLSQGNMAKVNVGKCNNHKGYKCKKLYDFEIRLDKIS